VKPAGSVEGDARLRLFCALTIPGDAVDRLVVWQSELAAAGIRAVRRENLHVTLAFLGGRPAGDVDAVGAELAEAAGAAGPIALRARAYRETRSVGMVVFDDEQGAAATLAADLHVRLSRLGVYQPERRPWLPHVTVVRFRERPGLRPGIPDLGAVSPSDAAVYHSVLRPSGARYVVVHSFSLAT
jgi:2'-5' RNA ligase